jgi:hypothetical protein
MTAVRITGGCQCGAVRYALHAEPVNAHICHCRMCQKAFGSYFAPLAAVPLDQFEVTRGTIAIFKSSEPVERGFCRDCGTPLTFRYLKGSDRISVALGSLDHPERVVPAIQFGIESRMPWFANLSGLDGRSTDEWGAARPEWMALIHDTNDQHPDHDTDGWPPPSKADE